MPPVEPPACFRSVASTVLAAARKVFEGISTTILPLCNLTSGAGALSAHNQCLFDATANADGLRLRRSVFLVSGTSLFMCLRTETQIVGAVLAWLLFALARIDATTGRLPNALTTAVAAIGTTLALAGQTPADKFLGAGIGLLLSGGIAYAYRALRGHDGLGFGDVKLIAGLGALVGWQGLPFVLLFASLTGIAFVLVRDTWGRAGIATNRLPFGPFLCLAGWIVWMADVSGWAMPWRP